LVSSRFSENILEPVSLLGNEVANQGMGKKKCVKRHRMGDTRVNVGR
jgi:hypothetical protein